MPTIGTAPFRNQLKRSLRKRWKKMMFAAFTEKYVRSPRKDVIVPVQVYWLARPSKAPRMIVTMVVRMIPMVIALRGTWYLWLRRPNQVGRDSSRPIAYNARLV